MPIDLTDFRRSHAVQINSSSSRTSVNVLYRDRNKSDCAAIDSTADAFGRTVRALFVFLRVRKPFDLPEADRFNHDTGTRFQSPDATFKFDWTLFVRLPGRTALQVHTHIRPIFVGQNTYRLTLQAPWLIPVFTSLCSVHAALPKDHYRSLRRGGRVVYEYFKGKANENFHNAIPCRKPAMPSSSFPPPPPPARGPRPSSARN